MAVRGAPATAAPANEADAKAGTWVTYHQEAPLRAPEAEEAASTHAAPAAKEPAAPPATPARPRISGPLPPIRKPRKVKARVVRKDAPDQLVVEAVLESILSWNPQQKLAVRFQDGSTWELSVEVAGSSPGATYQAGDTLKLTVQLPPQTQGRTPVALMLPDGLEVEL